VTAFARNSVFLERGLELTKYIFVTGGVVSSVGKGITVASIGAILKARGLSVATLKMDPYLNTDPSLMSPLQHGEVYVTRDGGETDLDVGNYERFTDTELTAASDITSGQVYGNLFARERRGDFIGGTVQVIPHLTNEIKDRFFALAERSKADVILVEVGGTVGDIEGQPFIEAIRQMRKTVGRENVLYIHVTLLPYIGSTKELKTKPTQHSVNELRRMGIQPDILVCRADSDISESLREKIGLFCDVEPYAVIPMPTAKTVYEVPLILEHFGAGKLIVDSLGLDVKEPDMTLWQEIAAKAVDYKQVVKIALVGEYVQLEDAYYSIREAIYHAGFKYDCKIQLKWVSTNDINTEADAKEKLSDVQGICLAGGFGERNIEGMIRVVDYAAGNKVPFFGIGLGMEAMVIQVGRALFNSKDVNSSSFAPDTLYPVVDIPQGKREELTRVPALRLGDVECVVKEGTLAYKCYGKSDIVERHRNSYEINKAYLGQLSQDGLVFSAVSKDNEYIEICERIDHPFMLGCIFHPEYVSRPNRPHPLFSAFIEAAKDVVRG
jgi:CTP synthase